MFAPPPGEGRTIRERHVLDRLFGREGSFEGAVDPAIEDEGRDHRRDDGKANESSRRQGRPPERRTWGGKGSTVDAAGGRESV
jgi:hypothetical protein